VRLLQVRSSDRHPSMQAAIVVDRPRWSPWLGEAVAPRLGHAVSGLEELYGLRLLRTLCGASCDLVTLRLQAGRLGVHALCDFEQRARRAGFVLAEPEGVTRTLLLDLRASSGELLASLSAKTRRKVRARESSPFEIRPITDTVHIEALKAAALASIRRTGGTNSRAPWGPLLALARDEPTRARVLALFRRGGQDVPLAFAAAVRHGALAEYMSAGSIDDAELRAQPFNYFLLWELADWARASGATHLDLGGLTEGGPEDALAGISTVQATLHKCGGRSRARDDRGPPARSATTSRWHAVHPGACRGTSVSEHAACARRRRLGAIAILTGLLAACGRDARSWPRGMLAQPSQKVAELVTAERGHPVLFALYASWCRDCRAELPVLDDLDARYRGRGLSVVALSLDEDPVDFAEMMRGRAPLPLGQPGKGAIRRHERLGGVLGHYRRDAA
jgi:thiol-disulfide isomerase/thioredoxin